MQEILEAVERDEIEPFFQAKVLVTTGEVRGAEALARWRHPRHGTIMPSAFIPALESAAHIGPLTMKILAQSAKACCDWRKAGFDMTVSVNVSAATLDDTGAADRILEAVSAQDLDSRHMLLEVTETAAGGHLGRVIENLSRLRMRGFGLSIDDFGTGYSSIAQLTRVPFTELKVDQAFVRHAASNAAARAVLESSLEIARKLSLPSVAEGVESKLEMNLLRELGCTFAQGYYIARPMAADIFMNWMLESRRQSRAG
jgi:EAL domain-containing protein (putative c-di-GMP-specific phosphodiesterase class I)